MADEKQTFLLDLDIKEFTEKALSAKGSIQEIGDSENLTGLVSGLMEATAALAAVGVAALALKVAFDATLETEKLEKANALFNTLAENAGVAAAALKEDLVKATGGLATEADTIQAANKALVTMSGSAADLGRVMDVSRKLSVAFGGDLMEKFNGLTYAISSGSTRMLKANGIMIDANKALKDYAMSIGVSVGSLTQAGRQQAILNAVLDYSDTKLKGIKESTNSATVTWQQLNVAVKEFGEEVTRTIGGLAGPSIRAFLLSTKELLASWNFHSRLAETKDDFEAIALALGHTKSQIDFVKNQIADLEKNDTISAKFLNWTGLGEARISKLKEELGALQEKQKQYEDGLANKPKEEAPAADTASTESKFDADKELAKHEKFETEVLKMKQAAVDFDKSQAKEEDVLIDAQNEEKLLKEREYQLKLEQLRLAVRTGALNGAEANQMELLEKEAHDNQMLALEQKHEEEIKALREKNQRAATSFVEGYAQAQKRSMDAQTQGMKRMAVLGTQTFNALQKNASTAFQAMGKAAIDHSQSAGQIMKGFFLNSLADIAQAQGELYLAMGLMDPAALAAGAGLLALSGVLRALAGGGGGSSMGGGGGGSLGGGAALDQPASSQPAQQSAPAKSVTLNIQGHYMETDQTKTWLMDQIRSATDATDFKYVQIGQT